MNIELSNLNETRREANVTFSPDDRAGAEKRILREFANHAKIPGFRPGKAPADLLRRRFAAQIDEELGQELRRSAFQEIEGKKEFEILNVVEVGELEQADDGTTTLRLVLDIRPDFPLPAYEDLALQKPRVEIGEAEVDAVVNRIRSQHAEFDVVERPAAKGDFVRCTYEGTSDGQPVAELAPDDTIYGRQENTWEEAGATDGPGVPGLADALVGLSAGDETTFEVTFPEDLPVESLRGRKAVYDLKVVEVRERKLPELNEDFLKVIQAESEEKLRENIAANLRAEAERESEGQVRAEATSRLVEGLDFPLPESLVEGETQRILANYLNQQAHSGVDPEKFEGVKESLFAAASESGQRNVRLNLVLDAIAEKEKVTVSDEDLSNYLLNFAMQTRQRPEDVVKELRNDRSRVVRIRENIRRGKTVDLLVEKANITEIDPQTTEAR